MDWLEELVVVVVVVVVVAEPLSPVVVSRADVERHDGGIHCSGLESCGGNIESMIIRPIQECNQDNAKNMIKAVKSPAKQEDG